MAGIKATEECLREQSYGKLLSVWRRVIKTDRFGLSIPLVPILGSVRGRTSKLTLEDSAASGILRGLERHSGLLEGLLLSTLIPPGPPGPKGLFLGSVGGGGLK